MKIQDLKKEIIKRNPRIEEEIKKDLNFQVSNMILEARIIKGVTQKELAKTMNTHQSSIARVESGSVLPSLGFLKKMAEALDTHLISPKFAFMESEIKDVKNESNDITITEYSPKAFTIFQTYAEKLPEPISVSARNYSDNLATSDSLN